MTLTLLPDVSTTDVDDGLVLLDQRSGRYWQLNKTGADTLRLLLDGHSVDEAAAWLTRRFPQAADRAADDVRSLVRHLCRARLAVPS